MPQQREGRCEKPSGYHALARAVWTWFVRQWTIPKASQLAKGLSAVAAILGAYLQSVGATGDHVGAADAMHIVATVDDLREDETTLDELERRLRMKLLEKGRELTGLPLAESEMSRTYHWLRQQEGVTQKVQREGIDPLKGRIRLRIDLSVPWSLAPKWIEQLRQAHLHRHRVVLGGGIATLGMWLATLIGVIVVDRLTGGYRRAWLLPGGLLIAVSATAAGWWYLFASVLSGS